MNLVFINFFIPFFILVNITSDQIRGCPQTQEWCKYTPAMTLEQFFIGFVLTSVGYPIGVTLIQTIFSKILGPRPQVYILINFTFFLCKF